MKLQQNELGAVVVDAVDLNDQGLKITYHSEGILSGNPPLDLYFRRPKSTAKKSL